MPAAKKSVINLPKYTLGKSSDLQDLILPSGATCQARRPGVQGLIAAGLLDSFDDLTSLVKTEHLDTKSLKGIASTPKITAEDTKAAIDLLSGDQTKLHAAFLMIDRLTAYVVTQPKVWIDYRLMVDVDGVKREENDEEFAKREAMATEQDAIAVRLIDLDDKVFLMQWAVGGSSDLTLFREGPQ
jgi:hypothetical protein